MTSSSRRRPGSTRRLAADVPRFVSLFAIAALALAGCADSTETSTPAEQARQTIPSTSSTKPPPAEQPDPCKVFTREEVDSYTGGPVKDGVPTGTGEGCNYAAAKEGGSSFLLTISMADNHVKFDDARTLARQTTASERDIGGVGDEAFAYEADGGGLQSAEARKVNVRVRVLIQGSAPPGKAIEALADALDRL